MSSKAEAKRTITFEVWNQDLSRAIKVTREGKLVDLEGHDLLLFPIGVMCEAIGRDPKTIRRWEKEKVWPKPQWKLAGEKRCSRWYSARQVMLAHEAYKKLCDLRRGYSHSRHFDLPAFLREVASAFYKVDAQAVLKGAQR